MNLKELDVVETVEEIREHNLPAGARGAIVAVFTEPALAYEVEFVDSEGRTIGTATLFPSQLRLVED